MQTAEALACNVHELGAAGPGLGLRRRAGALDVQE